MKTQFNRSQTKEKLAFSCRFILIFNTGRAVQKKQAESILFPAYSLHNPRCSAFSNSKRNITPRRGVGTRDDIACITAPCLPRTK